MLKDEDRIFQNLYNDKGSDVESSKKRFLKMKMNYQKIKAVLGWKLSV